MSENGQNLTQHFLIGRIPSKNYLKFVSKRTPLNRRSLISQGKLMPEQFNKFPSLPNSKSTTPHVYTPFTGLRVRLQ